MNPNAREFKFNPGAATWSPPPPPDAADGRFNLETHRILRQIFNLSEYVLL